MISYPEISKVNIYVLIYLICIYYVPDTVLVTWDLSVKQNKNPCTIAYID